MPLIPEASTRTLMLETTICTFWYKYSFRSIGGKDCNDYAGGIEAKGVKIILGGFSKENPKKAIVLVQSFDGVLRHCYLE